MTNSLLSLLVGHLRPREGEEFVWAHPASKGRVSQHVLAPSPSPTGPFRCPAMLRIKEAVLEL